MSSNKRTKITDYVMDNYYREKQRKKYEQEKALFEKSPAHVRAEQGRSLIKKMTYTNNKLSQVRLEAFNEISKELLGFIEHDLINLSELNEREQAEEIMSFYKRNFMDLEELSNGTCQNGVFNQPYDKFFVELMKLNAYFVYFARPQTFEIANVPISKIPYKERMEELLPHLESLGLFDNQKFTNRYSKFFDIKNTTKKV